MSMLAQTVIFLCTAVIAVPLSIRLGLGSVLGYLGAGIIIGPFGLGLISDVDEILHFAELGVVLLLFIVGLELQPRRLWALRTMLYDHRNDLLANYPPAACDASSRMWENPTIGKSADKKVIKRRARAISFGIIPKEKRHTDLLTGVDD